MYLLYVVMVVPCPTATTIRIETVVVVLQELPVVALVTAEHNAVVTRN